MKNKVNSVIKNKRICILGLIFLLYVSFVVYQNFSLLSGDNMLKFDIFNIHYPISAYLGDCITSGELPLWNPMVNSGLPHYAILGMPVWYPITMILSIFGYSIKMMNVEYLIHIVIAAFGAFMFIDNLADKKSLKTYVVSFLCGILYSFSGLFMSNSQHIMIIISAAFLPWILYFMEKFYESKKGRYIFLCSFCIGLTVLGGYPELIFATVITMFVYRFIKVIIINEYHIKLIDIWKIIWPMIIVGTLAILFSLVSLLPFFNSLQHITRGTGASVNSIFKFDVSGFFTTLIPGLSNYADITDTSMITMYFGVLVLICIPAMLVMKMRKKYLPYILFSMVIVFVICSTNFNIYYSLRNIISVLGFFRFPTVWRCVLSLMILVPFSQAILYFLNKEDRKSNTNFLITTTLSALFIIIGSYLFIKFGNVVNPDFILIKRLLIISVICIAYISILFIYNIVNNKKIIYLTLACLIVVTFVEITLFSNAEFPINIGISEKKQSAKPSVEQNNKLFINRDKKIDFTNSKIDNKDIMENDKIVFNRLLSSRGYMSFLLTSSEEYKASNAYKNLEENDEAFFTTNVIYGDNFEFKNWLNKKSHTKDEIFIESDKSKEKTVLPIDKNSKVIINRFTSNSIEIEVDTQIPGYLVVKQSFYPGWELTLNNEKKDIEVVNGTFLGTYLDEGKNIVKFQFIPIDFYIGLAGTCSYFVIILVYIIYKKCKTNKKYLDENTDV